MEKVVYILGAGFSAPLGLPVMANFISMSKDIYFRDKTKYGYFSEIYSLFNKIEASKAYMDIDVHNIEEVLSILEMKSIITNEKQKDLFIKYLNDVVDYFTPNKYNYYDGKWSNIANYWHEYLFDKNLNGIYNLYGSFLSSICNLEYKKYQGDDIRAENISRPKAEYYIVTLNYDMVIENLIGSMKGIYTMSDQIQYIPKIAKLHGSTSGNPPIQPPTWNKANLNQIKDEWLKAYSYIKGANHIRFVGYSLPITDTYVKYLLTISILNNDDIRHIKNIDVLCRDSNGDVKKRYDSLFGVFSKYRFLNKKVEDYFMTIENERDKDKNPDYVRFNKLEDCHENFYRRGL